MKKDTPCDEDLEELSQQIGKSWKPLGRRLQFTEAEITTFHKENPDEYSEKAYQMLLRWKSRDGKHATYQVLYDALDHKLVKEKRLAEEICCDWHGTACMRVSGLIETRSEHLGQNALRYIVCYKGSESNINVYNWGILWFETPVLDNQCLATLKKKHFAKENLDILFNVSIPCARGRMWMSVQSPRGLPNETDGDARLFG